MSELSTLISRAIDGDRSALARLLTVAEHGDHRMLQIQLSIRSRIGHALVVGITGPPGAGKSTLINALLPKALETFSSVAVLAVDPSSPVSQGALLGDRVRIGGNSFGDKVFFRSMASRGEQGGLSRSASTALNLFDACGWPIVFVETLGIGQVELDIMKLADTTLVVLPPGWGDSIQANKAGLTEVGDIFVINKADKPGVEQSRRDLLDSLALLKRDISPVVTSCTARLGDGVSDVWDAIRDHQDKLQARGTTPERCATSETKLIQQIMALRFEERLQKLLESEFRSLNLVSDGTLDEQKLDETTKLLLIEMIRQHETELKAQ